jgi:CBS domain-containing protein
MLTHPTVSELMSHPLVVVEPALPVAELLELAERRGVHHFPIVDHGALVGLVCTGDLHGVAPQTPVSELMRRRLVAVSERSSVPDAARVLAENAVGSAVVVDADGIRGIVTRDDLASAGPVLAAEAKTAVGA